MFFLLKPDSEFLGVIFNWRNIMHYSKNLSSLLILSLLSGCASGQEYKKPPSMGKSKSLYKHEQFSSPASKQVAGAAISGIVGGLLGPLGILVTAIGSSVSQKQGVISYLKQMNSTEMAGIVIEDVTTKRNQEFLDNPRWFINLPAKEMLPKEVNVDLGSGNSFIFPVVAGVDVSEGDVVTIIAPPTTHNLASIKSDFYKDLPQVTEVRCMANDIDCITASENEPGIVRRLE
jgi:hypothetical protein